MSSYAGEKTGPSGHEVLSGMDAIISSATASAMSLLSQLVAPVVDKAPGWWDSAKKAIFRRESIGELPLCGSSPCVLLSEMVAAIPDDALPRRQKDALSLPCSGDGDSETETGKWERALAYVGLPENAADENEATLADRLAAWDAFGRACREYEGPFDIAVGGGDSVAVASHEGVPVEVSFGNAGKCRKQREGGHADDWQRSHPGLVGIQAASAMAAMSDDVPGGAVDALLAYSDYLSAGSKTWSKVVSLPYEGGLALLEDGFARAWHDVGEVLLEGGN